MSTSCGQRRPRKHSKSCHSVGPIFVCTCVAILTNIPVYEGDIKQEQVKRVVEDLGEGEKKQSDEGPEKREIEHVH